MNRSYLSTLLFLLPSSLVGCNSETSKQEIISGRVINASDSSPIVGAIVSTDPPTSSVITNADGNYSISNVLSGIYIVTATKAGYMGATIKVSVTAGKTTTADLSLMIGQVAATPTVPFVATNSPTPYATSTAQPTLIKLTNTPEPTFTPERCESVTAPFTGGIDAARSSNSYSGIPFSSACRARSFGERFQPTTR